MYRKSRVEARSTSMLPKPRLTPSLERRSVEARRGSQRSSSAEPVRPGAPRLSRDASASKIPLNRKAKSQQSLADRHYSSAVTPQRNSVYSRATTTPVRTPSQDRGHSWQASVERALAFVTHKDHRPISDGSWQRQQHARISAAMAERAEAGGGGGAGGMALIRPLTITRFVDICSDLLNAICGTKLSNENYVAKLPNYAKHFLYPGAVSKSWLKTVNTLHAFPQALAIIAYFLDLVEHIERPVSEEWLYRERDAVSSLRREYIEQCWLRFEPDSDFRPQDADYVQRLSHLLGDHTQRIAALGAAIEELEAWLGDESCGAGRAEEERCRQRRDALWAALRAARREGSALRERRGEGAARGGAARGEGAVCDHQLEHTQEEIAALKQALSSQPMSVSQRQQLVAEAQYAAKVADSKRSLADQLANMVSAKEAELSSWQQRALDSCVRYKRALIQLSARHPQLKDIAVDEKELMSEACAASLARGVEALRGAVAAGGERRAGRERLRGARLREAALLLEEARASVAELESAVEREASAVEAEAARDCAAAARWVRAREELHARRESERERLLATDQAVARARHGLEHWERQDALWRNGLSSLHEHSASLRSELSLQLASHKRATTDRVIAMADKHQAAIDQIENSLEKKEERQESTVPKNRERERIH